jgi:phosphoribosyl-dephospho-CoA transferase
VIRPPARHDLAWLSPAWRAHVRAVAGGRLAAELAAWLDHGLPAMVRRRLPGEEGLPLGVALPPGGAGRRVSLLADPGAVARLGPPPALSEVAASAPSAWRAGLAALEREARRAGLLLRVHGSLAWQHLSGERYVGPASDVDLLFRPADAGALARGLALLAARGGGPPRLDGEILLGEEGVSWRELLSGRPRLLVKGPDAVDLRSRAALLARIGAEAA